MGSTQKAENPLAFSCSTISCIPLRHTVARPEDRLSRWYAMENIFAELVSYPCNVESVGKLVEQIQPDLDGIFFTGYFFFSFNRALCGLRGRGAFGGQFT